MPSCSAESALGNAGGLRFGFLLVFTFLALLQILQHDAGEAGREWEQSETDQVFYFTLSEKQERIGSKD